MDIIQIRDLHFSYPDKEEVLQGVNLTLEEGKFYILCGKSGCGKSTLLRQMKSALMPKGNRTGRLSKYISEEEIGFVFQNPDNQLVTDRVWHELVFGMENLGFNQDTMHLRVAEFASYFGIEHWFDRDVSQLSGGQKQLLNLASVLILRPKLLLLDEPTAWLDPMAASEFLHTLYRIQRELGMTVFLTAHQLEEVISYGDELLLMEDGCIVSQGNPVSIGRELRDRGEEFYAAMPVPMRIYLQSGAAGECPCTISDGREWLRREFHIRKKYENTGIADCPTERGQRKTDAGEMMGDGNDMLSSAVLKVENLWFRYPGGDSDILRGVSFQAQRGEILGILGGNGSGKSTLLSLLSGVLSGGRGKIKLSEAGKWLPLDKVTKGNRPALLPQDVTAIFHEETVGRELMEYGSEEERRQWIERFHLEPLLDRHIYDISGGERQRAALVKLLLRESKILLLDEPTKGIDAGDKKRLGRTLQQLSESGITVVLVSHDLEFIAEYAHQAGLFFRGKLEGILPAQDFFCQNHFYTTAAHRMSREVIPNAVTVEDVLGVLAGAGSGTAEEIRGEENPAAEGGRDKRQREPAEDREELERQRELMEDRGQAENLSFRKAQWQEEFSEDAREERGFGTLSYILGIFLLFPALLWLGTVYFHDRRYLLISMGMLVYVLLPFFRFWEKHPPKVQKLVVLSVLTAVAVAGRCAFYMLPGVKPMAAIAVVAGISMGAESGFFVGAMSMLVSNMMFGQGPWTPWQMLAMGLVGLFAGIVMHRRAFKEIAPWHQRVCMALYGMAGVLCLYGGIMNPASLLMTAYEVNWQNIAAIYLSGLPIDLVHAAATAVILLLAGIPMLKRLERMKKKYDLCQ